MTEHERRIRDIDNRLACLTHRTRGMPCSLSSTAPCPTRRQACGHCRATPHNVAGAASVACGSLPTAHAATARRERMRVREAIFFIVMGAILASSSLCCLFWSEDIFDMSSRQSIFFSIVGIAIVLHAIGELRRSMRRNVMMSMIDRWSKP